MWAWLLNLDEHELAGAEFKAGLDSVHQLLIACWEVGVALKLRWACGAEFKAGLDSVHQLLIACLDVGVALQNVGGSEHKHAVDCKKGAELK